MIIITNEVLFYDAPLYKKRIPVKDIKAITLIKKTATLIYEKDRKIKKLDLPAWRGGYYFPQIFEDLKEINPDIKSNLMLTKI